MKLASCCAQFCLIPLLLASVKPAQSAPAKLTGRFACDKCTASRVAKGDMRPSNPVCAKKCIEDGSEVVFLSEQGKESLKVRDYASAKEDLGYHIEVTGEVDPTVKTISILTVKRLSYEGASCARPQSSTKK